MTLPIILDCDPGNDDAVGILIAAGHPGLDLLAVTTGHGHLEADHTAHNAAIALAAAGALRVPVTTGSATPMVRGRLVAGVLDLDSALDAVRDDLDAVAPDARSSVTLMAEILMARTGVTLVCTGPLTNLALLLRLQPRAAAHIAHVVTLGGAWGLGNKTAAAEWNILSDPEAAAIVYGSGLRITMIPIDATAVVQIDTDLVEQVATIPGQAAGLCTELLQSLRRTHRPGPFQVAAPSLNDPLALLVAAQPALVRTLPARVEIETAGWHSYGRSVIDFGLRNGLPANADVVVAFDIAGIRAAFLDALHCLSDRQARL